MTIEDRAWLERSTKLAPWLWRLAYPPRRAHNRVAFKAWEALLRAHRLAWLVGVRL